MNNLTQTATADIYDWLIFKTNVSTEVQKQYLALLLQKETDVQTWTIDMDDVDCVLRVKPTQIYNESEVIDLIHQHGFKISPLPD
jgi:hypothetical protein